MNSISLKIWIVDDDESVRWVLEKALKQAGLQTQSFSRSEHALKALKDDTPDVLITDVRMPGMSGLSLLEKLQSTNPTLPIIVITAYSDLENAVAAYKGGAFEYLPKPFDIDEAVALVYKAARSIGAKLGAGAVAPTAMASMIGKAPAMQEVYRSIGRLSGSSMTVLITGESGTGKELVARALHDHSPRADKTFVALNTSAIASELLESELFGHEKGSFTGADSRRIGRFEQADQGTLFLDEIGDMSPALQTRLLRVLAESEFYRVGGQKPIKVDVRVIAATNQDLSRAVKESRFREDLYHRLNVIRINTPPLRQRREDIPLLLEHYLAEAADEIGGQSKTIDSKALEALQNFGWPGNVRQLVNVARRLTVTAPGSVISLQDIPDDLGGGSLSQNTAKDWTTNLAAWAERQLNRNSAPLLDSAIPEFEKALIKFAMAKTNGHRQEAAKLLGWGRNTLARKMKSLDLD